MATNNNLVMYDPTKATLMAKAQGQMAGIQAGNAEYCGVAMAPTSIYNQAGYYAMQDTTTGAIHLQKLQNDSIYTNQWYDQGTGTIFNFNQTTQTNNNGTNTNNNTNNNANNNTNNTTNGTTNTNTTNSNQIYTQSPNGLQAYPSYDFTSDPTYNYQITNNTSAYSSAQVSNQVNNEYAWGQGYVAVDSYLVNDNTVNGQYQVDENGEIITLTADDVQEMVDSGIYTDSAEALYALSSQGYLIEDEEQAKLGIYTDETESQISMLMEKLNISRDEAIVQLGDKAETAAGKDDEMTTMFNKLVDSGFSKEEAREYLMELGYEVPESYIEELPKYSEEDQAKIDALVETTGCTPQEAADILGVEPEKDGWLKSFFGGVGDFFCGIGEGIANGWNAFWDWVW